MHIEDEKKVLEFKAKAPISIFLDDERADYKPGCSVLEVFYAEPVSIEEIKFRNNYTAHVCISLKRVPAEKDVKNRDILPWQTSVKRFVLMEEPENERFSQDVFSLLSKESSIPWTGVVSMRIILKQPSFRWKKFGIDELAMFGELTKDGKLVSASHSATMRRFDCKAVIHEEDKPEPVVNAVSKYIYTVSELMREKQTGPAVGRFEVDGSYDIGHLI